METTTKTTGTTTMPPSTEKAVSVEYTNWKGETGMRKIVPMEITWGATEWHPTEQWLMRVWDLDRNDFRMYAMKDIKRWDV